MKYISTIKILERRLSGVFIFNFEHILHLLLVFLVDFGEVNIIWFFCYLEQVFVHFIPTPILCPKKETCI